MAQYIKHSKQKQGLFFPSFLRDRLSGSDFVWFVIDIVKNFSLKPFKASLYDEGGNAYDPAMMVPFLGCSCVNGSRSRHRIKKLCERDIAFHLVCDTKAVETHP